MVSETYAKADEIQIKGSQIFSPVRQKWLLLTPEELVRQEYLKILIQEYGYDIDQFAEEINVTGRGSAQARADFAIWRTVKDKREDKSPFIIVECKSDNVAIKARDYAQGQMRRFLLPIIPVKRGTGASRKIRCPVTLKR